VTTAKSMDSDANGQRLLSAVERLVDDSDTLIAQVEAYKSAARLTVGGGELSPARRNAIGGQLIDLYSTRSAISGGATALPGLLPGVGSAIALVGGALVDVALTLKYEVEMVLSLTYLHGHDIRDERERWLAYVIAGVRVYEAESGRNYLVDLVDAELDALPRYASRELFKLAGVIFGRLLLRSATKGLVKTLPLIGVVLGASTNKSLTTTGGCGCVDALERRAKTTATDDAPIVDAEVR
jgi:uncharacterized protein (DUF697 family)